MRKNDGYAGRYEAVIGLEVHCELKTGTKIFCACSPKFGDEPNTHVCPVCLGMPGTLPVLSEKAVRFGVMAGLALGCDIHRRSWFDRKNYYYPDLPKGYQITQYEQPICTGGAVSVESDGETRSIRLTRIHLEEDAGKLIHRGEETLIDYNRAGVPLIEIVSEPDMRTPEEAKAYLNALRRILSGIGVSDCRMNEGSLRCDVNVSVRRKGETAYGVKCEIKNINSVNYVGKALEDEITRQIALVEAGERVLPETRRFNEDTGKTERMRVKETVVDYRYFTEPNIPPIVLTEEFMEEIRHTMPPLPDEAAEGLIRDFGVKREDAVLLTADPRITAYFLRCAETTAYKSVCANLFVGELLPKMGEEAAEVLRPEWLGEICDLFGEGKIVSGTAKKLAALSSAENESPLTIAKRQKLLKITDEQVLAAYADEAIAANPKAVADYRKGKTAAAKQLLGAVMRLSSGGADPVATEKILLEKLAEQPD